MHPLVKYTLSLLFSFCILNFTLADQGNTLPLYDLDNEATTLAVLAKKQPLFITRIYDYQRIDTQFRFITLVEMPKYNDFSDSIICIPLKDTSPIIRRAKTAIVKKYIKGDFMRSKLYFVKEADIQSVAGNSLCTLINTECKSLWSSSSFPEEEGTMKMFDQAFERALK